MKKIIDKIVDKIVDDWRSTIDGGLVDDFKEYRVNVSCVPLPKKGILKKATRITVCDFVDRNMSCHVWLDKSFDVPGFPFQPSKESYGKIMSKNEITYNDVCFIVSPTILRYVSINRFLRELDGGICDGIFKYIRYVDKSYELKVRSYLHARNVKFIFLYDNKTEKKAKELERIILKSCNMEKEW